MNKPAFLIALGLPVAIVALATGLWALAAYPHWFTTAPSHRDPSPGQPVTLFAAAALRPVVEHVIQQYQAETGRRIHVQWGGSNTLLSQIQLGAQADLYLAGDTSFIDLAQRRNLVRERLAIASMQAVLVVPPANPAAVTSLDDLLRPDLRISIANPDQAAVGAVLRTAIGTAAFSELELKIRTRGGGVFKPTEPDVAADVALGTVDAGVVWNVTALNNDKLRIISEPRLQNARAEVHIAVCTASTRPAAALHFARYLAAADRGITRFQNAGFQTAPADPWADRPRLILFAGAVNRRSLASAIQSFQQREGVDLITAFDGCGILTGRMKALRAAGMEHEFPDLYVPCDVCYLDFVPDDFGPSTMVSATDIVIVTTPQNPASIHSLTDLQRPGVRVVIGEPRQATIGLLTYRLLQSLDWDVDQWADGPNVVAKKPSSAMLVPAVITGAADAAIAYRSDTVSLADQLHIVPIDSPLARARQPITIANRSRYPNLARRFIQHLHNDPQAIIDAGFTSLLPPADPILPQTPPSQP